MKPGQMTWHTITHRGSTLILYGQATTYGGDALPVKTMLEAAVHQLSVDEANANVIDGIVKTLNGEIASPWRND